MMFQPLSDALGLALALSMTAHADTARHAPHHTVAETRWGELAVVPDSDDAARRAIALNGVPVAGLDGARLWIVRVEPISPMADRAVIAAAEAETAPPTQFRAVTITASGARPEPGGLVLRLRGAP